MTYNGDSFKKNFDKNGELIDPEGELFDRLLKMFSGKKNGLEVIYNSSEEDYNNNKSGKKDRFWKNGKLVKDIFYDKKGKVIKEIDYSKL